MVTLNGLGLDITPTCVGNRYTIKKTLSVYRTENGMRSGPIIYRAGEKKVKRQATFQIALPNPKSVTDDIESVENVLILLINTVDSTWVRTVKTLGIKKYI